MTQTRGKGGGDVIKRVGGTGKAVNSNGKREKIKKEEVKGEMGRAREGKRGRGEGELEGGERATRR